MVKKSLAKISSTTSSGSTSSGNSLDSFGNAVNALATSISDVSSQIATLSGTLALASARLSAVEAVGVTIGTSTGNTDTIVPVVPEILSSEDHLALDMLLATAE